MKKFYQVIMIVLPIFVGSLAIGSLILRLSGNFIAMNPFISIGLAVFGILTGIVNILRIMKE